MELNITAREYADSINEMTGLLKKKIGEMVIDDEIDTEVLDLLKGAFSMIDVSTRLVRDQACMIQEINDKLDKLLESK